MTDIKLIETIGPNKTSFEIEIKGHSEAERNTKENDLCCCAVSVLGCTLLANIEKEYKEYKPEMIEKSGYIKIALSLENSEAVKQAETIINTIFYGFELIEKNYPKNIKLETKIKYEKN